MDYLKTILNEYKKRKYGMKKFFNLLFGLFLVVLSALLVLDGFGFVEHAHFWPIVMGAFAVMIIGWGILKIFVVLLEDAASIYVRIFDSIWAFLLIIAGAAVLLKELGVFKKLEIGWSFQSFNVEVASSLPLVLLVIVVAGFGLRMILTNIKK